MCRRKDWNGDNWILVVYLSHSICLSFSFGLFECAGDTVVFW